MPIGSSNLISEYFSTTWRSNYIIIYGKFVEQSASSEIPVKYGSILTISIRQSIQISDENPNSARVPFLSLTTGISVRVFSVWKPPSGLSLHCVYNNRHWELTAPPTKSDSWEEFASSCVCDGPKNPERNHLSWPWWHAYQVSGYFADWNCKTHIYFAALSLFSMLLGSHLFRLVMQISKE